MTALYLGSDHGGYRAKVALKVWLAGQGWAVTDCGTETFDPNDDYPLYAAAVARLVSADPTSRGILLCRSGQGMAIAANKFPRVRAAVAWNQTSVVASRTDDDTNILCLPADQLTELEIKELVGLWLATPLKSDDRYRRRLRQIEQLEAETMCGQIRNPKLEIRNTHGNTEF
ncbi:MAG: RpiB/LacA/LacB family sugar-phosphate isomerase [Patescibacteria group bacterium]